MARWSIGAPVPGAKIQGREFSEREFVEGRLIVGTTAQRPAEQALALADRQVVDAGDARVHQAVRVEFPVLVAVAAEPGAMLVLPFVGEAHCDPVDRKSTRLNSSH